VIGVVLTADRSTLSEWFWWTTVVFGFVAVGGLLEGFGVTTDGRFAIIFGVWTFIAGLGLQSQRIANQTNNFLPAV